ncbi:hypothetical protein V22_19630 [Calycomorphotria hydatis]|uniref:Uncharacterized protein n=1 Tax=Calycomorphotria hydatis TaxID=2528027 RepID=A0A517T8K7_9PLAN|nr:hypothetical protein V22_19630 [Calycomorphotria hydatis]
MSEKRDKEMFNYDPTILVFGVAIFASIMGLCLGFVTAMMGISLILLSCVCVLVLAICIVLFKLSVLTHLATALCFLTSSWAVTHLIALLLSYLMQFL